MEKKYKVLVLSDHALSTSGVGCQTRFLIEGLLAKYPGEWTFRQFGAAVKHSDYSTISISDDFIITPIDGFGDPNLIRTTLAIEKPDILLLFTDPRFFIWLWEMEDEIHQVCPIAYWHVWDNYPYPTFNRAWYLSNDLVATISKVTDDIVKTVAPEVDSKYIPHAVDSEVFSKREVPKQGHMKDKFVFFWNNSLALIEFKI